ncbi:MAG: acyl-CoA dehydratase activase [Coriobacteriales bacterium]|nr:acyl-CoA dehydratase activase [Coriobacteriales bacterium]
MPEITPSPLTTCGYACKYTPSALFAGCGVNAVREVCETSDASPADAVLHPNLCGYAKALACSGLGGAFDGLVLTNCCDSLRRCADALRRSGSVPFMHLIDLPRCADECAVDLYAAQLRKLTLALEERTGRPFDLAAAVAAVPDRPAPAPGPYLAVVGARLEPSLRAAIESRSPVPVRDLTCMGAGGVGPVPDEARQSTDAFIGWYARALLSQESCMRMTAGADRRRLALDPDLAGVIYHGLKFCDFYSYDYQTLASQVTVPITRLETDWTSQDSGQTLTRIEALIEGLGLTARPAPASDAEEAPMDNGRKRYFAGIDSGSTSTDVAIIDRDATLVAHVVRSTGARAIDSAEAALSDALSQAGISKDELAYTVSTGYGRTGIGIGDAQVTEITCHARGAHHLDPQARTIIDIGGQDSKAIRMDEEGAVVSFAMNDKCAAGTGRFLEAMARILELSVDELAQMGTDWDEDITLSTMCTVFAESEVVSLIAQNKKTADIVHGLDASVASKTAGLVQRVHGEPEYLMTGGVAQNAGVVAALATKLGSPVRVPPDPQVCGALGAALIARDRVVGQ